MPEIIGKIKKSAGVAGQVAYDLTVQYPDEEPTKVGFVGYAYGAPGTVVAISPAGRQTYVSATERFGDVFNEDWVRAFMKES
jgi:hypothetical protein